MNTERVDGLEVGKPFVFIQFYTAKDNKVSYCTSLFARSIPELYAKVFSCDWSNLMLCSLPISGTWHNDCPDTTMSPALQYGLQS